MLSETQTRTDTEGNRGLRISQCEPLEAVSGFMVRQAEGTSTKGVRMEPWNPVPHLAEIAIALMESTDCDQQEAIDLALLQYDDRRSADPAFRRLVQIAVDKH